jgi:hypothetical protein
MCGEGVELVFWEWVDWHFTTDTSGQAGLRWPPVGAACRSVRLPVSDEVGVGFGVAWALTTRPPRTMWYRSRPSFSCSEKAYQGLIWALAGAWRCYNFGCTSLALACSWRLYLFPLTVTTIFNSVVNSAAPALKLLLWSDTLHRCVRVRASHKPRCTAAVTLVYPKRWQRLYSTGHFWSVVHLHLYSQAAAIGERTHISNIRA